MSKKYEKKIASKGELFFQHNKKTEVKFFMYFFMLFLCVFILWLFTTEGGCELKMAEANNPYIDHNKAWKATVHGNVNVAKQYLSNLDANSRNILLADAAYTENYLRCAGMMRC
eukprot:NODE_4921_length_616_cov_77.666667_g4237_i0.p2 GENE.NODE_4921_length_616_cov_77.666667_g4237_i0~~NODE_4921_length_616_cov_77.666667_g4237_i0.p2  ORF type:complete len:114 (+),score=9.32 NODE_4921_length_616_cov_77.666667_g4237_i0:170-511(+)